VGWKTNRAQVAGLARRRAPDDPDLVNARRDLAAERLSETVRQIVDRAPPLTPEQRDSIAALLRGPATAGNKTFTQGDVDRIVAERVARTRKRTRTEGPGSSAVPT
jgi:hypothetical protein